MGERRRWIAGDVAAAARRYITDAVDDVWENQVDGQISVSGGGLSDDYHKVELDKSEVESLRQHLAYWRDVLLSKIESLPDFDGTL